MARTILTRTDTNALELNEPEFILYDGCKYHPRLKSTHLVKKPPTYDALRGGFMESFEIVAVWELGYIIEPLNMSPILSALDRADREDRIY